MTKTWDEVVRATKLNCRGEVTEAVVDAVLRALIAEGLAIVPREATQEIVSKAWEAHADAAPCEIIANPGQIHEALLAAISAGEIVPPKREDADPDAGLPTHEDVRGILKDPSP